jgi:GTP-binding protein Era
LPAPDPAPDHGSDERRRAGLVSLVGRANVGKSSLINSMMGRKVSIVSDKPQTTRGALRAVLNTDGAQVVFVDTPGLHKPRTLLGQRLNRTAFNAVDGVDVVVLVVDGRSGVGGGDRFVADRLPPADRHVCVVNKVDGMARAAILGQLQTASEWGFDEYFAVSARTGAGVAELVVALARRLPEGSPLYPEDDGQSPAHAGLGVSESDQRQWLSELVREQLLAVTREELPYSIACQVTDWDWPYLRCEILVERGSQKGMVIGHGGAVLKKVGTAVRAQLPPGAYIELSVRVAQDWQRKPEMLDRLGL